MNKKLEEYDDMRDYLRCSIVTPEARNELLNYLEDAFERLIHTLDLIPHTHHNKHLLELGANPYFQTLLIKKYKEYHVQLANFFGEDHPLRYQEIVNEKYKEKHGMDFLQFNVEKEPYPYSDKTFGVVLCCEILEHLIEDPVFMLSEIHRVLDNDGILILTTPNVCRTENIKRLKNGMNIYDPYSAYGIYGRHNREYTMHELEEILTRSGFIIEELCSRDIHTSLKSLRFFSSSNTAHGENIFCRARKDRTFSYYYPEYLFRSFRKRLIIKEPYVRMGENDSIQLGEGWHQLEDWGKNSGFFRWTKGEAESFLNIIQEHTQRLTITAHSGMHNAAGTIAIVRENMQIYSFPCNFQKNLNNYSFDISKANIAPGIIKVTLKLDTLWNPATTGSNDNRELGIAVKSIAVE